ncbi:S10 family serine carboxypeptidase-like protein [Streptomyces hiroshimensis]|uniref:S10 family serine carboxypeptidase-like protein n=1 Tax=Streptomyces hiroshimensis TaxID=66424 RepID=UPI0035715B80
MSEFSGCGAPPDRARPRPLPSPPSVTVPPPRPGHEQDDGPAGTCTAKAAHIHPYVAVYVYPVASWRRYGRRGSRDAPPRRPAPTPGTCTSTARSIREQSIGDDAAGTISVNSDTWNQEAHVIFWDQPLGTGYSYSDVGDYVQDEKSRGPMFREGLQKFFSAHPEYARCPLYVCGRHDPRLRRELRPLRCAALGRSVHGGAAHLPGQRGREGVAARSRGRHLELRRTTTARWPNGW